MAGMINGGTGGRYEPGEAPAPEDGGEEGDDDDEAGDGEEEEEVEVEVEDVDTGVRTKGKTKKKKGSSGKGARWMGLEDLCLTEAWKVVGLDPITGAQQTSKGYWKRIHDEFQERRFKADYAKMHMIRGQGACQHRWGLIQAACNLFHGYLEKIRRRKASGKMLSDQVNTKTLP